MKASKKSKLKILIVSYFFYPENMPRAFRTFELAKGFSDAGHEVDVYIPKYDYNYDDLSKKYRLNITTLNTGSLFNKDRKKGINKSELSLNKKSNFKLQLSNLLFYFFGERKSEYAKEIYKSLIKNKKEYDLLISISYPVYVHAGVAKVLNKNPNLAKIKIADCGDPYYFNQFKRLVFYHKYYEKKALKPFDYIAVPTEKAIDSYLYFKNKDRIKVIPQAFDFKAVKLSKYKKNKIVSFGYAGAFDNSLRNPEKLFKHLLSLNTKFKFIIFPTKQDQTINCISQYINKLGSSLIINKTSPRDKVIYELSKCDFLVNVDNMSSNQVPSKLIDYTLTKRPIYSFIPDKFKADEFNAFLKRNYKKALKIDIKNYDIKKIAQDFIEINNQ